MQAIRREYHEIGPFCRKKSPSKLVKKYIEQSLKKSYTIGGV
jgi:hypothetical protein